MFFSLFHNVYIG